MEWSRLLTTGIIFAIYFSNVFVLNRFYEDDRMDWTLLSEWSCPFNLMLTFWGELNLTQLLVGSLDCLSLI